MTVKLTKGGNVNLTKDSPNLSNISVGLGWSVRSTSGYAFDLDASCFLLNASGRVRNDKDFIFYNELKSVCGSVVHQGDNRTGEGEGDDEIIKIDLKKVSNEVQKIVFCVTIHDGVQRGQNFGMVSDAFMRIVNDITGDEVARYDLSEDAGSLTSMIFGEIYRNNGDWKFKAVGQGFNHGLGAMASNFGVQV